MTTSNCGIDSDALWDLVDGLDSSAQQTDLHHHVTGCTWCQSRVQEIQALCSGLQSIATSGQAPLPESIGDYRIIREVGMGGMGVVYEAQQQNPSRAVALKVMHSSVTMTSAERLRAFRREVHALGRLSHPSIATVHDAGQTDDGRMFLVMELIDGRPIDRYCDDAGLDIHGRVRVVAKLARAVFHAHEHGVMHRDLKPANVLVDTAGVPHVLDFGLARFLDPELDVTMHRSTAGNAFGTLPFMSPQQLAGDEPGVHDDVYSLGVILFRLLTGLWPYANRGSAVATLQTIMDTDAAHPSTLTRSVPADLGDVAMKAIAKEPERRYATALAFAEDLERFVSGKAVQARPPRVGYRLRVFGRRHRRSILTSSIATAVALPLLLPAWLANEEARAFEMKTTELSFKGLEIGTRDLWRGWRIEPSPDGAHIAYATDDGISIWDRDTSVSHELVLAPTKDGWRFGSDDSADALHWAPDSRSLALLGSKELRRSESGNTKDHVSALFVIDTANGKAARLQTDAVPPSGLFCWTTGGDASTYTTEAGGLCTVSLDGACRRWDGTYPVEHLGGYSPDGSWLLCSGRTDSETGIDVWLIPANGGTGQQLTHSAGAELHPIWNPTGDEVWYVKPEPPITTNLWAQRVDVRNGEALDEPRQVTHRTHLVLSNPKFLDSGELVFAVSKTVDLIRIANSDQLDRSEDLTGGRNPLPSPDGVTIYYIADHDEPGLYTIQRDRPGRRLLAAGRIHPEEDYVPGFDLTRDGTRIVYFLRDRDAPGIYIVPTASGKPRKLVTSEHASTPRFSPDGQWVAYTNDDGLWIASVSGEAPRELSHVYSWEGIPQWSPDGRHIACLAYDSPEDEKKDIAETNNAVFLVRVDDGKRTRLTPPSETGYREGLSWHPSGVFLTYVLYGSGKNGSQIRMAFADGSPTKEMIDRGKPHWDYTGVWAPDGKHFFFQCANQCHVHVYDHDRGEIVAEHIDGLTDPGLPQWSRDGATVVWYVRNRTTQRLEIMDLRTR